MRIHVGTVFGGAALLALSIMMSPVAALADECGKACGRQQKACIGVAKNDYFVARHACLSEPDYAACVRTALAVRRNTAALCKQARYEDCTPCCEAAGVSGINFCATNQGRVLPAAPQQSGDPQVGRENLIAGDVMTCGVPYKIWDIDLLQPFIAAGFAGDIDDPPIPGRTGNNANLPYFLTAFTTPEGVDVVNANCLLCHGSEFDGDLVIGLGNPTRDFTSGAGGGGSFSTDDETLDRFGLNEGEKEQVRRLFARGAIIGPQTVVRTVGMNPAEMLAVILMAHHDRDTLAWSETPLFDIVVRDENGVPIEDPTVTSDPPPWWRVHKKNALFYNGMARGDHRGTMSAATSVCVDSVPRALEVDDMFKDINAFIESLRAPAYPREIDGALADDGRVLFNRDCAGCHGSYDADEEEETYPNLLIPLDVVKTDPVVANAGVVHTPELVDWYNQSFYGLITPLEPNDPFPGYMPPPLDGIWATAPFFHNGSVPTIELVLNSAARPTYWRRNNYDSRDFDEDALGWPWTEVELPQAEHEDPEEAKFVYDTTYWSQSNKGHPFGDHLSGKERKAVLEYLKTL